MESPEAESGADMVGALGSRRRMSPLGPEVAYRLWAPSYESETVVSALENRIVGRLTPDPHGRRLLDVGCGTGRRLRECDRGPSLKVGLDLAPAMLLAGTAWEGTHRAVADLRRMPLRDAVFELIWCRLVIGHVPLLAPAYMELVRVAQPGGHLIISDFHPAAVAAGHRRTFRDEAGRVHEVEHHARTCAEHVTTARSAGWSEVAVIEAAAGEAERHFYDRAGRSDQFERERNLPLVMVLCLRR